MAVFLLAVTPLLFTNRPREELLRMPLLSFVSDNEECGRVSHSFQRTLKPQDLALPESPSGPCPFPVLVTTRQAERWEEEVALPALPPGSNGAALSVSFY